MAELETREQAARRMRGQTQPTTAPAPPATHNRPQPISISPGMAFRLGFYAGLGALVVWIVVGLILAVIRVILPVF